MPLSADPTDRLVDLVRINVGRPGDVTLADYVLEWINKTQRDVCKKMNYWFMRKADFSITLTAGQQTKVLPTDFKDDRMVSVKRSTEFRYAEVDYMEYEDFRYQFDIAGGTRGMPTHYTLDGEGNILFAPIADVTYNVCLDYWRYLPDNVAGVGGAHSKMVDEYADVLECGATARAFAHLTEWDDSAAWEQKFQAAVIEMNIQSSERELPSEMTLRFRPDANGSGIRRRRNSP